jgi:hypothetical protein
VSKLDRATGRDDLIASEVVTQNRTGAVEAVNKFENLVILEWHSITEPVATTSGSVLSGD